MARDFYDDELYDDCEQLLPSQNNTMLETPLTQKILAAVAAACVVGGGTVVLNSREKIAVLEYATVQQQAWNARIEEKVDKIADAVGARK